MDTSSTPKRRCSLCIRDRLDICEKLERGVPADALAKEYGVHVTTVQRLRGKGPSLQQFSEKTCGAKRKRMRNPASEELDQKIYEWFVKHRALGDSISGPLLCEKALEMNKELGGSSTFKASNGWLARFKDRHGIRQLPLQGEKGDVDKDEADEFVEEFARLLENENVDLDNVYNMDETGLLWKSLPDKTLVHAGERRVDDGRKSKEDRVTIGICANATGSHKLPLLFLHKYENPMALRNIKTQLPVVYMSQKNAWVDRRIFATWYKEDFVSAVKQHQLCGGTTGKVLLLVNNCPGHQLDELHQEEGFEVLFLPPNTTSVVDQGVVAKLKRGYRRRVLGRVSEFSLGVKEFLARFDIKDCIDVVNEAWRDVTDLNVRNSWRPLVRDALDAAEHDREHTPPDSSALMNAVSAVVADITEGEVNEWLLFCDRSEDLEADSDEETDDTPPAGTASSTPRHILGEERIEEMMSDLRLWSEDQPEHVRLHAEFLLDWFYQQ